MSISPTDLGVDESDLLITPDLEPVAHRLQKAGPSTLDGFETAEAAITWLWAGWHRAAAANMGTQAVWVFTSPGTGVWIAFDLGDAATDWASMDAERRYWACFAPLLGSRTRSWRTVTGPTVLDLIAGMHIRDTHRSDTAWVRVARSLLSTRTEEAAGARLLIGLGGGGAMGQLLLRRPNPLSSPASVGAEA